MRHLHGLRLTRPPIDQPGLYPCKYFASVSAQQGRMKCQQKSEQV